MKNIALLTGGFSTERGISLTSAEHMLSMLDKSLFNIFLFDVSSLNDWWYVENYQIIKDRQNPDQKFEKLAILAALRQKSENPYTREPLDALGLVEDDELKKCIDSFVAEKISAAERHSEP